VSPTDRNSVWADALLQELARSGVRELCVAPGSRSTPLVLAAARADAFRLRVFLDERSAAFFALGVGKGSGMPAAVVTTSGTAVANLLPAVVEACQSETPLLLLTADRPHHLRDSDANQAISQPGIFGAFTRAAWDLPQPRVDGPALLHLRAVADRAVAAALGAPAGPVHLNLPFDKPLEPSEDAGDVPPDFPESQALALQGRDAAPLVRISRRRAAASESELERLADLIDAAERPVLVAGIAAEPGRLGPVATRFAAACGMPLLADPLSGARFGPSHGSARIAGYDLFLRDAEIRERLRPDLVLRLGAAPTSASLLRWLGEAGGAVQVVVDDGGRWKDHQNTASLYVAADGPNTLESLMSRVGAPAPLSWRRRWDVVDRAAARGAWAAPGPRHEGHVAAAVVDGVESGDVLFVSSSMPIRDVDAYGAPREEGPGVFGNRGASGIDGIVSTAAGVAAGTGLRTVVLLGDLALLHDTNGLLSVREEGVELVLVVVNNDGGGIFHMLPVREFEPPFTELFATPHGLDLAHLARLHGLPHTRVESLDGVEEALRVGLRGRGSRMIEVLTDREANRIGHQAAVVAATTAARDALEEWDGEEGRTTDEEKEART
jgi:2-succinyl-5-enolpyruvyl-6-hydroxy-3-cyclohexene-1-carboxylate synthase